MRKESHIPDADLILAVDGEMSMLRKTRIRNHLTHCWTCRARMKEIEDTIRKAAAKHNSFLKELGLPLLPSNDPDPPGM